MKATTHAEVLPDVLTVMQVARLLGVSRNTVYDACSRQEIPHRRVGTRILFSRTAIFEWLAATATKR